MSAPSQPQPLSILLVDDDQLDRESVRRALRKVKAEASISEADSISEAEQQLGSSRRDCIILDYRLPEGPCIEFLPRLRQLAPHAAFIVLTGQGDETVAVELMKAGAADYLSKDGLDPGRLWRAISYAVTLRRAEEETARVEQQRKRHAAQLRRFAERAPTLVSARNLQDLAADAADAALDLLEASESFVLLRHGNEEFTSSQGAPVASRPGGPLPEPLDAWCRSLPPTGAAGSMLHRHESLLAVSLRSRDGDDVGCIAVRLTDHDASKTQEDVLAQAGVLVAVCRDNLALYEAASRAVRARDDVMAVVSHDLRTPLNNIKLGSDLLRAGASANDVPIIDRIDRSADHMARLVDDLVDMVRIEGGKIDLTVRTERVDNLLEAARQLISPQTDAAGLKLAVGTSPAGLQVHADRHRVLQVLANLLGNAVKFTPNQGEVELSVQEEASRVRFSVRDTGSGIPPAQSERLFSRFSRFDSKKRRGLGLGLYIAKGLIEAHQGQIWFESTPGAGTTFHFTLPRVNGHASGKSEEEEQ